MDAEVKRIMADIMSQKGLSSNTAAAAKEPAYDCPVCKDTGWVIDEDTNSGRLCECQEMKQRRERARKLFQSARIPERFKFARLDNFESARQPEAYEAAVSYVDGFKERDDKGRGLVFVGDVGTGKTHLSYGILYALLRKGIAGLAMSVPELMDDLRPSNKEGMELLKTVPFLLLDDLGAQYSNGWVTERMYIIVNARYIADLPTVITSNTYLEDLQHEPGWRPIVDRLVQMCDLVRVEGESYRRRRS